MDGPITEREILALIAVVVALAELTRLHLERRKGARHVEPSARPDLSSPSDAWDRNPYFRDYKEQPRQRRISRRRKLGKEKTVMTEQFGDWLASTQHFERKITSRKGVETTIYIREFSEEDVEKRDSVMIDQGSRRDRRGNRGGGQIELKIENRRKYDLFEGVVDWDIMVPKTNKQGKPIDAEGNVTDDPEKMIGVKLEVTPKNKLALSAYASEQMLRHVREINDLPMEDEDLEDDKDKKDDNPYSGDSGFDKSAYSDNGNGDSDNVVPLEETSKGSKTASRS